MAFYKKKQTKSSPKSPYQKQIIEIAKLANYQPSPSILPQHNDFNFTVLQDGHLKRKIKQQLYPIEKLSPQKQQKSRKQGSPSHPRSLIYSPNAKRFQHHPTNTSQNHEGYQTVDTGIQSDEPLQIGYGRGSHAYSPHIYDSQGKSRIQKQRNLIKHQNRRYINVQQNTEESEGQTEYQYDTTPGPGYYSYNASTFKPSHSSGMSTKNTTRNSNFSFGSKAQRFIINPQKQPSFNDTRIRHLRKKQLARKQRLNERYFQKQKKIIPFLSKSPKLPNQVNNDNPSPQDYRIRQGIQQQLIQRIQRNFKGSFGGAQSRFGAEKFSNVGPGAYQLPENDYKPQINQISYFFASNKPRFE